MTYTITAGDIEAFTEGDCWVLAREINRRTGWRVVALGAYPDYCRARNWTLDLDDFDWVHVLVQTPDGAYLDVNGTDTAQNLIDHYADQVYGHYGWHAEDFDFEPIRHAADWEALGIRHRLFPQVPVAKVAANLIRAYHTGVVG